MTGSHTMPAEAAADLLDALIAGGVDVCVGGGWAVDALVGQQTREHSDLDVWLPAAHLELLIPVLGARGLDRLLPVPGDRPWNFVLHDGARRRVDLHLYERLPGGDLHYGSMTAGHRIAASALAGKGTIAGRTVPCESADWALACHTGYPPRAVDHHDVPLLCARFGLELPHGYH